MVSKEAKQTQEIEECKSFPEETEVRQCYGQMFKGTINARIMLISHQCNYGRKDSAFAALFICVNLPFSSNIARPAVGKQCGTHFCGMTLSLQESDGYRNNKYNTEYLKTNPALKPNECTYIVTCSINLKT